MIVHPPNPQSQQVALAFVGGLLSGIFITRAAHEYVALSLKPKPVEARK